MPYPMAACRPHSFGDPAPYSAEALAFFARLATPPSSARALLYDAMLRTLVLEGILTKHDALSLFAAADSPTALTNLVQAAYGGTLVNAPSFTADQGYTGASTKSLDTGFNPTSASSPRFTRNDASFFIWSLTSSQSAGGAFGQTGAVNTGMSYLYPRFTDNNYYVTCNRFAATAASGASFDGSGMLAVSRTASGTYKVYRNGHLIQTKTGASEALFNSNFHYLVDRTSYYTGQVAAGGFGAGLTDAEQVTLYNAVRAYLAAVGLTVPPPAAYVIGSLTDAVNLNEAEEIYIYGAETYAYVPCRSGRLAVVDISNPLAPTIAATFTDGDLTEGMGCARSGNTLFLVSWNNHKLISIDISDPENPTKISSLSIGGDDPGGGDNPDEDELRKVFYAGGYCFVTHSYEGKLYIVDVGNPASMSITGSVATGDGAFAVHVVGNYAYVGGCLPGTSLKVIDVSNKAAPAVVKTITDADYNCCSGLAVSGSYLYAAYYYTNKLVVFDISDPANTTQVAELDLGSALDGLNRIFIEGDNLYAVGALSDTVGKINISNPLAPALTSYVTTPILDAPYGLAVRDGVVYAVGRTSDSLAVFEM